MDAKKPQTQPISMTREELQRTMRTLEPMYDLVRVVDPSVTEACTLDATGELDMPHCCFDLLAKGRRCRNCISARTVANKQSVSKFEFVGDDAFYISTRYVEVEGQPRSIELVKQVTGDTLFAPADNEDEVRDFMEGDADRRYRDAGTGALNRRYLEDGIGALRGDKVAMLRAIGLDHVSAVGGTKARDIVLSSIAGTIMGSIREVDTLVHFEDDTFVIIFEGIPQRLFPKRLKQIRQRAIDALAEKTGSPDADVVIGAIVREGTLDDLITLAQDALETAEEGTSPIVLLADDLAEGQKSELADVPTGGMANMVDALTGLALPALFREQLQVRINRFVSGSEPLHVVHLDVENFKAFNRAYGLAEGDVLLVNLAAAIREEFPDELATRSGVDKFDLVTRADDVEERVGRLRARLATLRRDVALELKAGICDVRDASLSATAAIDRAKIACDSIKGKYDLAIRLFDGKLERQVSMRDYLVDSLDSAIAKGHIQPYYQAIVRSFTGNACAMEALSRWEDPIYGLISPADVIPTLERHHLIHKHDVHIVRCVCRDMRAHMDKGNVVLPVSVNLSRLDFELCNIFEEVEAAVAEYRVPREMLGIEVTESTLDKSNEFFRPQVEQFRKAGYEIWMDDFGSGYSSLNLLKDYEFDVLKIDMAFLRGLEENHNSKEIISSIVDMAKRIGIRTLAEGVETDAQYLFLRNIGCEMIQGYLFSRPTPFARVDHDIRMELEDQADRGYLESVGRVNLLSQQPTEAVHPTQADGTSRGMPLAIVEWNGSNFRYFTANDAYLGHLHAMGFSTIEDAARHFNNDDQLLESFGRTAKRIEGTPGEHVVSYETDGKQRTTTIQFVASGTNTAAFLINPQLSLVSRRA